jgi:two-component system sensor kinase FixL
VRNGPCGVSFRFGYYRRAIRSAVLSTTNVATEEVLVLANVKLRDFVNPATLRPASLNYWLISGGYLALYFVINVITDSHQFRSSGITLWSPDNGLSLLLMMESIYFSPVVLIGEILADKFIHNVSQGFSVVIISEVALTFGYVLIAIVLRVIFRFNFRTISFENLMALLAVVPTGTALTMSLFCGVLYYSGAIPIDNLYAAAFGFWLGDTVGIVIIVPAAIALFDLMNKSRWRGFTGIGDVLTVLAIISSLALFVFISTSSVEHHQLFYLLFLPIIWVGLRFGYVGVSLSLLATQALLIAAVSYYHINDSQFGSLQTLMFILSITGLLLGAVVTEREQSARLVRQQQSELARIAARAATGAMASTLAHEISQPLSALASYVYSASRMLEDADASPSVTDARSALMKAESEAQRARIIIERIRDFVSSGRLQLEPVDLIHLVEKIRALNVDEAKSRGVDLTVESSVACPAVTADKIAIEQALNNLVVNAIDSASSRGDSGGQVRIRHFQRSDDIVLQVDDNGAGVAPEIADRLFETFETTKLKGMGLGLPLTLQIAKRHSGRLGWRPLDPQGASFFIEVPIHGPEKDAG